MLGRSRRAPSSLDDVSECAGRCKSKEHVHVIGRAAGCDEKATCFTCLVAENSQECLVEFDGQYPASPVGCPDDVDKNDGR